MKFTKLEGTGNDFIVIDARDLALDWSALAIAMCDRHYGAGADGLLLVRTSDDADARMRLFNADGSEAEMSGNGLRCFVKYCVERDIVPAKDGGVTVETLAGVLTTLATIVDGRVQAVRIGMGRPRFAPQEIPMAVEVAAPVQDYPLAAAGRTIPVTCLSMGNPHAVLLTDEEVARYPLAEVGPQVERHELFPNRVNFEVARVIARDRIEARTWERGVGETLACGTGASAVMVAARLHGAVDQAVELVQPGGTLVLEWDGEGEVALTGPAEEVFEGEWPDEPPAGP